MTTRNFMSTNQISHFAKPAARRQARDDGQKPALSVAIRAPIIMMLKAWLLTKDGNKAKVERNIISQTIRRGLHDTSVEER